MLKRVTFVVLAMMIFAFATGYAAEAKWEKIDEVTWLDVNSIKIIHDGLDECVMAVMKTNMTDNGYSLMTILINKNTKEWIFAVWEIYDSKGNLTKRFINDVKDKSLWKDGTNKVYIQEILKRAK